MSALAIYIKTFIDLYKNKLFMLIPLLVIIYLLFSGYDQLMTKLGFETKAAIKTQLTTTVTNLNTLQLANKLLKSQILTEEQRHKNELEELQKVLDKEKQITAKLQTIKQTLDTQAIQLKNKIKSKQKEAYQEYKVPENKYLLYSKEEVNLLSVNNYDSIYKVYTEKFN